MKAFVFGLSGICALITAAWAAPERLDPQRAMERSEAAVGRKIGNYDLSILLAPPCRSPPFGASRSSLASSTRPALQCVRQPPSI